MKKYGYFHSMALSFYSRDLYRDVAQNWGGKVFWYLFLVMVIFSMAGTYKVQANINIFFPAFLEEFAVQAPEVNITKGIVKTPQNRPYLITDPDTKEEVAIIDTSGKYTSLDHTTADFLLTKTTLMTRHNNTVKTTTLSNSITADIKPEDVKKMAVQGAAWGWVMLFPVFLLLSYIYRVLQALFYSIFGKIIALILSADIAYFDILKLTMVAVTPAIFLKIAVMMTIGHFPFAWLVYFLVAMGYLIFALGSLEKKS